jgi:hypothetical protein
MTQLCADWGKIQVQSEICDLKTYHYPILPNPMPNQRLRLKTKSWRNRKSLPRPFENVDLKKNYTSQWPLARQI